jgi:hypothetical protein
MLDAGIATAEIITPCCQGIKMVSHKQSVCAIICFLMVAIAKIFKEPEMPGTIKGERQTFY